MIYQKVVSKCKLHAKFMEAFQRYDRNFSQNPESIISKGRGFQKIRSLKYPVYIISECQAISTGDEQAKVDQMPLVFLPKKHLKLKVDFDSKPHILFHQISISLHYLNFFSTKPHIFSHNFSFPSTTSIFFPQLHNWIVE